MRKESDRALGPCKRRVDSSKTTDPKKPDKHRLQEGFLYLHSVECSEQIGADGDQEVDSRASKAMNTSARRNPSKFCLYHQDHKSAFSSETRLRSYSSEATLIASFDGRAKGTAKVAPASQASIVASITEGGDPPPSG